MELKPSLKKTGGIKIYALSCEDNCFYIGKTTKSVEIRFNEHKSEELNTSWTKLHPVLEIIEVIEGNKWLEDSLTLEYMEKYGISKVRGGSYCRVNLSSMEINEIKRKINHANDLCFKCGKSGHYVYECNF